MRVAKSRRRRSRQAEQLLSVLILLAILAVLIAGIILIAERLLEGSKSPPAEPMTVMETPTETETEIPTEAPTGIPITTEAPTEAETTLPPGSVTGVTLSFYRASMHAGGGSIMPLVFMEPEDADNKAELWESSDEDVASVDDAGTITPGSAGHCTVRVTSADNPAVFAEVDVTVLPPEDTITTPAMSRPGTTTYTEVSADGVREDIEVIDGITYVQGVMMVNKTYPLPASYNPGGLTPETQQAFRALCDAAAADGYSLFSHSDFRNYSRQAALYDSYCARDGQAAADRFSARPGHSEHQTGMVIDVNWPGDSFNDTAEAQWLEAHCAEYGFVIRFPREKEEYTGYKYESWHIRYVGVEWAEQIMGSGLCMEEFFNVKSVYP